MKLLIRIGIFVAFVAALAFIKIKYLTKETAQMGGGNPAAAGGKGGSAPATGVMGFVVKSEKLDNKIFATGSVVASEMVDLKPEVAGKIVQLNIIEGKIVYQGVSDAWGLEFTNVKNVL